MAINEETPLLLGSASPRRRDLLAAMGLALTVRPADIPEAPGAAETPEAFVERMARDKLTAVSRLAAGVPAAAALVADTVVVIDGRILGKPADAADHRDVLERLAGRTHRVLTRYAIAASPPFGEPSAERTVETAVTMRPASRDEIERYVATGEGADKAGGYAVQGLGAFLVRRLEGSYSNVVGLPVCEVIEDLQALDLLGPFP